MGCFKDHVLSISGWLYTSIDMYIYTYKYEAITFLSTACISSSRLLREKVKARSRRVLRPWSPSVSPAVCSNRQLSEPPEELQTFLSSYLVLMKKFKLFNRVQCLTRPFSA